MGGGGGWGRGGEGRGGQKETRATGFRFYRFGAPFGTGRRAVLALWGCISVFWWSARLSRYTSKLARAVKSLQSSCRFFSADGRRRRWCGQHGSILFRLPRCVVIVIGTLLFVVCGMYAMLFFVFARMVDGMLTDRDAV